MGEAKGIVLRPIDSSTASAFIRRHHYSGSSVRNSQVHIGVFRAGQLGGVMQFGPPLDRKKILGLVEGAAWDSVLELNRMAFTDDLPRNSESRAIGVACRMLRRYAPQVGWIVSFADGTQCGDGAIYRASGFVLTAISPSANIARFPDGSVVHKMRLESGATRPREFLGGRSYFDVTGGRYAWREFVEACGGEILPGFQLRYIRFLDPSLRGRLTVEEVPFSRIDEVGARMYLGEKL